jgi:hypothetical protein
MARHSPRRLARRYPGAVRPAMSETTIKKVEAKSSPKGEMGQKYLVSGKSVSMRLWEDEPPGDKPAPIAITRP